MSRAIDPGARVRGRRLAFGLATVLGLAPRGFFIPYRYAGSANPAGYPALHALFDAATESIDGLMQAIEAHRDDLQRIAADGGPARFDQDWFPRLDAAALYALVRRERPRLIVEIGSGHSTRFLARAIADGGLATELVCIDPAPRAALDGLNLRHRQHLLSEADAGLFETLAPGDILFIDSSHVAMPGTDVDRLFLDVLPRLARGVLVHVHDVFLPDAYPAAWTWRGYNEQLLAGALLQGRGYEIVFASHYVAAHCPAQVEHSVLAQLPLLPGAYETSLWLRKS
ncbi:MAG TPA: class I SAM-dependent methyltransferase [Beijerinckiaceae bacterium]|nr:class I SAM-dependent methyltransferase [Beijerinckiaceae bacterium]